MKTARKALSPEELASRARHRELVLATLADICRGLERLQGSEEARAACREVMVLLEEARAGVVPAGKGRG